MSNNKKQLVTVDSHSLWTKQLFSGDANHAKHKLEIIRDGIVINEIALDDIKQLNFGRHPNADVRLESAQMAMFHLVIAKKKNGYFIEDSGSETGSYLNSQRLDAKKTTQLRDGYVIKLPGFYLRCVLPDSVPSNEEKAKLNKIYKEIIKPVKFPQPKSALLQTHLIENRHTLQAWEGGLTTLLVSEIIEESGDTKTFRLVGETPLLFSYKPGQFVTLILEINGENVYRSYSMSSSPSRPHTLDITVKRVANGLVSNWLCDQLVIGDSVTVKGPSGKFTCFDYPSDKILFICAGSGITPIMSMMRWIADTAAKVDIKMLVSSKTVNDIIFYKELELISARHSRFQIAATLTANSKSTESWLGFNGRVNENMLMLLSPDVKTRHVFVCGPENFMQHVETLLHDMKFPMGNFHTESFVAKPVIQDITLKNLPSDGKYKITFSKSGVTARTNGEYSILEIAKACGINIESNCCSGSCGICIAKCKGEVEIDAHCEIDEKEKQAGYIFSCCSRAKSDIEIEA